ncbi:MAG: amino acid permease [Chlamydiales bacterium]|nr:amino acid permease [Chlamydiales bacterium]
MNENELHKGLKPRHIHLIALGGIIGSAYFLGTGYLVHEVGPCAFLAYILGALITYLTMMCLAELTIAMPTSGSFVSYAAKFVSPAWACGVGWSYWMTWVVYIPSECLAAGIIMNYFVPNVSEYIWAVLFGLLVTGINISHVKTFGEVEFWLAIIKILALVLFCILAVLIFFGVIGSADHEIIEGRYIFDNGGFFPNGGWVLLVNMVMLLVNFQGSEIIGLSASEAHNVTKTIPKIINHVTYRIIGLYLIPTFLLVLIFPWQKANLSESVFAMALQHYGMSPIAHLFSFVVLAAALSCANGGLYGTVRSMYALSKHGMAPKVLSVLNKQRVPARVTLFTLGGIWCMLGIAYFFSSQNVYANLLAISGFTGAVCWISICWCQLRFRRALLREGRSTEVLHYSVKWFPYLTHLSIWLQVGCLVFVALNEHLRASFYFGVPVLIIPMLLYKKIKKNKMPNIVF